MNSHNQGGSPRFEERLGRGVHDQLSSSADDVASELQFGLTKILAVLSPLPDVGYAPQQQSEQPVADVDLMSQTVPYVEQSEPDLGDRRVINTAGLMGRLAPFSPEAAAQRNVAAAYDGDVIDPGAVDDSQPGMIIDRMPLAEAQVQSRPEISVNGLTPDEIRSKFGEIYESMGSN